MHFHPLISFDYDAMEELIADTEQRRMCWMHHDILSDVHLARLLAEYSGQSTPVGQAWHAVAWVAAGRQPNSFYILYKWYDDFCAPPEQGDLYYIRQEDGQEFLLRAVSQERLYDAGLRDMCSSLWNKISENDSDFFGENTYDGNAISDVLELLDRVTGQEMECFDWHLDRRSDGEKAAQCRTIAAYFAGILAR